MRKRKRTPPKAQQKPNKPKQDPKVKEIADAVLDSVVGGRGVRMDCCGGRSINQY